METQTTPEKMRIKYDVLYRNIPEEGRIAAEIETTRDRIQNAVDSFNAIGLKPLQQHELNYCLSGGYVWIENRWKDEQEIPTGWPKNMNREKFLEALERPDFTNAVAALEHVNILHPDLFYLQGDQILINDEVRNLLVNRETIYLNEEEQLNLLKLNDALQYLDDFGLLQRHPMDPFKLAPVDLNDLGYSFSRFPEEMGRFTVEPRKLKTFLSKL